MSSRAWMTASSSVSVGTNLGDMPTAVGAAGACRCNVPDTVIAFAGTAVMGRFVLVGLLDTNILSSPSTFQPDIYHL